MRKMTVFYGPVFDSHFPGKPGLTSCPLDSQSPLIRILAAS